MVRSKTPSHIFEAELLFNDKNPSSVLVHAEHSAVSIYNACLNECLKRLHKVQHDREFQQIQEDYKRARRLNLPLAAFKDRYRAVFVKHGYGEYSLQEYASVIRKHFPSFGSAETQQLATRAYRAVDRIRLGKAEKVKFVSSYDGTSFEGKSHTSKLHYDEKDGLIHYGKYKFKYVIKRNDEYAAECMTHKVKYIRILRRTIRKKERWYVQFVMEGQPPVNPRHSTEYGDGAAGIDPGVSTMAVVTKESAHLYELAPGCAVDERKIRRLQRAMDRSKRAVNKNAYNPDGTIKPGKHEWKYSKRYKRLRCQLKDSYRRCKAQREISHHILAKKILKEASYIKTETMSYKGLKKRAGRMTQNKKNGKNNSKKRYGKTIRKRAPARLIAILNEKLSYTGRAVERIDTRSVKASQYNPLDGTYTKKDLKDRMIDLGDNIIVQRDLLSAYIILHTVNTSVIDIKNAYDDFHRFKELNDIEINRLTTGRQLSWYTS